MTMACCMFTLFAVVHWRCDREC